MQFKHTSSGLTLLEIMFSLMIASLILLYLIPQQLNATRTQMIAQTVAEMNQIVVAARNYYQDSRTATPTAALRTLWPQSLSALSTNNYLPPAAAALCSPWPSSTYDATCGYHVPYTIFPANAYPANTSSVYDTNAVGIVASGSNKGGNFWGVSIVLPNATVAQAVQQKLPFASLCNPAQLKTGSACTSANTSNTVTAIVPRPAQWSQQAINYLPDGLVQRIGQNKGCLDTYPDGSNPCNSTTNGVLNYKKNVTNYISMPSCAGNTTPVLFLDNPWVQTFNRSNYSSSGKCSDFGQDPAPTAITNSNANPGFGAYFPGLSVLITKDTANNRWIVQRRYSSDTASSYIGAVKIHDLHTVFFSTCAPNGDPGKWDPSNFPGKNITATYMPPWTNTYLAPGRPFNNCAVYYS